MFVRFKESLDISEKEIVKVTKLEMKCYFEPYQFSIGSLISLKIISNLVISNSLHQFHQHFMSASASKFLHKKNFKEF
jgi:hypothetical protein